MVIYQQQVALKIRIGGWLFFLFFVGLCVASVVVAFSGDWASLGSLILGVPFALVGLRYAIGRLQWSLEGDHLVRVGMMGPVPTFPVRLARADYRALRVLHEPGLWVIELTGETPFQVDGLGSEEAARAVARAFAEALGLPIEA